MSDKQKQKEQIKELLKIHYGFDDFRPGQEQAIDNILDKKDTVVIMPTGGGKSLIFQMPALVLEGVTIVISPLIALMKDQVDSLVKIGIPATFVNSSISFTEAQKRLEQIKNGEIKLLYIAPERFYNKEFIDMLLSVKVSLFAIDEAHCISQWGHDFRPSYMRLKKVIELLGSPPVIALTATATPEVRKDIAEQLELKNPEEIVTGFARSNLRFGVSKASGSEKLEAIIGIVQEMTNKSGIIYAGTRGKVDEITQLLLENGIEATAYHAGMDTESRSWVQESFLEDKTKIIVVTNAFGLGIDKSNIRFIIHHDIPGTIEAYYQEAGRAGRDGKESHCFLFFSPRDRSLREFFIKGDNPNPETIIEVYEILSSEEDDKIITTYAEIKSRLSDDVPDMTVGTSLKLLEKEGYISRNNEKTSDAFLKLINDFKTTIDLVSKKAKKRREILEKLNKRFENELMSGWQLNLDEVADILEIKKDSFVRALNGLKKDDLVVYNPPKRGTEIKILKRVLPEEVKIDFKALKEKADRAYEKLDKMEEYVDHFGCRQKFILDYFSDLTAKKCGKCDNCSDGLSGMGGVKRYEPLNNSYKKRYSKNKGGKNKEYKVSEKKNILSTKLTQLESLDLFNKGDSIKEIAKKRGITEGTVAEHLCFLIEKKLIKNIDNAVEKSRQKKIEEAIEEVGREFLKPIKEKLGDKFSWEEIKIVRSFIKK